MKGNFKFLSKRYMRKEHIKALRESRRIPVKDKVVSFGGSFIEHYHFENVIWAYPSDDPILNELEALEVADDGSYDFQSLSVELKKYMRMKDDHFYNRMYKKYKKAEEYGIMRLDEAVEKAELDKGSSLTNDEFMELMIGNYEARKDTTFKKAKRSASRAYKKVLEYGRCNADRFKYFCTLTFARKEQMDKHLKKGSTFEYVDDVKDYQTVKKAWDKVRQALSKAVKREGLEFEFLTTWERHKDGSFHLHMLCTDIPDRFIVDCPEWLDIDYKTHKRRHGRMLKHWKYGKSDIEEIRDKERITTYISKYIVKSFCNADEEYLEEFQNAQKYWASKGLEQSETRYYEKDDKEFEKEIKKMNEFGETHSSTYKNVYDNHEITKVTYSVKSKM